jgi:ribosomal protein L40E
MRHKFKICLVCLTKNAVKTKICSKCGQDFTKRSKRSFKHILKSIFMNQLYPDKS